MLNALVDFIIGFLVGRSAVNSGRAARNSALAAERAAWTEAQKDAYQKRQMYLAGERRFVFILCGVLIAAPYPVSLLKQQRSDI